MSVTFPTSSTLSPQQLAVLSWVQSGSGSLNLIAYAGTGKTFTLMEIAKVIKEPAFMGAFNKSIADEFKERLSAIRAYHVKGATIHSAGLEAWKKVAPRATVEGRKVQTIARNKFSWDRKLSSVICSTVSMAKQAVLGAGTSYTDPANWQEIIDYHDLQDDIPAGIAVDKFIGYCMEVYKESLDLCEEIIDFDDMLLAPLFFKAPFKKYKWVLIDECQDTNTARRMIAFEMMEEGSRMVAVGDRHQCQPAGTMVYVVRHRGTSWTNETIEKVPIENLKAGDRVISYNQRDSSFIKGRRVNSVRSRDYNGSLIRVALKDGMGRTSSYTPNHICLANFLPFRSKHAVYLMRKNRKYRIGSAKMDYRKLACGPSVRTRAEGADSCWILETHDSATNAQAREILISAEFGIPQLMFTVKNNSVVTQEALDNLWSKIDNTERGEECLVHFGRHLEYPLFSKAKWRESMKRPILCRASNLMTGCLMLPYHGVVHGKRKDWEPVKVSRRAYKGKVYSLDVSMEKLYCADGIMTHNSIYGFAGASSDSMDKIADEMKKRGEFTELPLSVTYRCPKAVVDLAQNWVPDFEAHPTAPEGQVTTITDKQFWEEDFSLSKDVILCRNTRPLVGIAGRLRDERGIACIVEGMNGKGLMALAIKWGEDIGLEEFLEYLDEYEAKEKAKWAAKSKPDKVEYVEDKCGTMRLICHQVGLQRTTADLSRRIDLMFNDPGNGRVLRLCTIHRSKGREWERVYLIGRNRYMPSHYAKKEWELQQEENLAYVAVTRAKGELVEVEVPFKKKGSDLEWWEKYDGEEY